MTSSVRGLGAGRYTEVQAEPAGVTTSVHQLTTADGAKVAGVLRVPPGARTATAFMHPRQDSTNHPLIPRLLEGGLAVWTQGPRSPNNDLSLIHEQAVIDFAAGQAFLRDRGFGRVFPVGHSGGATLAAFYLQQASRPADGRLTAAPSGRPVALGETAMPRPDGVVFLAPHPGQGALLQRLIDPSVTDEDDPLSADPALDPFSPANGFRPPPEPSHYDPEFVTRYQAAQVARVRRIDARASALVASHRASGRAFKETGDIRHRRAAIAPALIAVYRTDADLRNVDLTQDPNARRYGSLFGRRPDLTNSGLVGFGRLSTAEAWMSTWSATTTNADFLRCAPEVTVPTLLLEFTGDQASFPADIARYGKDLGATDLTIGALAGTHFGDRLAEGAPTGNELAAERILAWIAERL